jgi:hypothetical protein
MPRLLQLILACCLISCSACGTTDNRATQGTTTNRSTVAIQPPRDGSSDYMADDLPKALTDRMSKKAARRANAEYDNARWVAEQ